MSILEAIVGPVSKLLDKIIPDPQARDRAKLELLKLQGDQEMQTITAQMQAIVAEAQSSDPWTSRARPSFLYMMYAADPLGDPDGPDRGRRPPHGEGYSRRHDGISARHSRGALRALRHRLPRLHGGSHLG